MPGANVQLVQGQDGQIYIVSANGQVVPLSALQGQSSLAPQQPGILGGLTSGINSAIESKYKPSIFGDTTKTTTNEPGLFDKLASKFGLGSDPSAKTPISNSISNLSVKNAPSFDLQAAPDYNLGLDIPGAAPSVPASVVPDAGASIVPDSLPATLDAPGQFSLGANAAAAAETPASTSLLDLPALNGSTLGSTYLPAAAGAYGFYNLAKSQANSPSGGRRNARGFAQGGASGASLGFSIGGPIGAGIGAAIGAPIGFFGSVFGSHKGERQMDRDAWRKRLLDANSGLFDSNYQGTLADNSSFDFGKDKFGFGTGEGQIDLSKPAVSRAAAWGNALAGITGNGSGKGKEAVSTQFTAASTANLKDPNNIKTVKDNYKHFLSQLGINNKDDAHRYFDQASANGMDRNTWAQGTTAIDDIFSNQSSGFDKNGNWIGSNTASSSTPTQNNNGSPGRRPKKK